jgi:hypothetical protein
MSLFEKAPVVSALYREDVLKDLAAPLERAHPWAHRRPPV